MQEILEAIQAGAGGDELAPAPPPRVLPGRLRPRGRRRDVRRASPRPTRTPASRSTSARSPRPSSPPTRSYVAVMASSINFNTVWTSIFEPLPTFGFLDRLGRESVWGARHDQHFHVVGSDASGRDPAHRLGRAQLEAGRPGGRPLQPRRRPGPLRPRRLDAGRQPAHLGLRDQLRRPGRALGRQGQPADAEAGPPHLGGGGGQRAVRLHLLPHARRAATRPA